MQAIDALKTRRSIRRYSDKNISKDALKEIIDCARLAPSANNQQPWEFVVVTQKETLTRIANAATYGKFIKDAGACIVVCGRKNNKHLVEDCCIASQNILTAAWSMGIGSCWVAGWKRTYNPEIMHMLGIPQDMEIVSILSLGYADEKPEPHGKRKLQEVLHWEKF
jgi:nitroreductase